MDTDEHRWDGMGWDVVWFIIYDVGVMVVCRVGVEYIQPFVEEVTERCGEQRVEPHHKSK
jgi:hypothetical protein